MADTEDATLDAVKRKLNVTWEAPETEARIKDVIDAAGARVAYLVGLPVGHSFSPEDGQAWPLFLDACLYEYSDAMDDFIGNYGPMIQLAREQLIVRESLEEEGEEP